MPHVAILYNQLQTRGIDSIKIQRAVDAFKEQILLVRNKIRVEKMLVQVHIPPGKRKVRSSENNNIVAKEVCDIITVAVEDRMSFTAHLTLATLFDPRYFEDNSVNFPEEQFNTVLQYYPFVDATKLKSELRKYLI
jgi:hypothetical protein